MKPLFLYLETAETACTVAVFEGETCRSISTADALRDHAARLAPEVQRMMGELSLSFADLSAISVHNGPGSYTGLRVSLSLAKGICLASGLPLIALTGHELTAKAWLHRHPAYNGQVAMLTDARRNDAYVSVFSTSREMLFPPSLQTLSPEWAAKYFPEGPVVLMGSGAEKCSALLQFFPNLCLDQAPSVPDFGPVIMKEFLARHFADLVSVVPMYISPVNITQAKK